MDPLSIAAGASGILATVVTTSFKISKFIGDVRDASNDMVLVTRELDGLSAPLTQLSDNHDLVMDLEASGRQSGCKEIMSSCEQVLKEMATLMEKVASGRMSSVRWAISGRSDMGQLRSHLEAYKSALVIALSVHTASLTGQIARDAKFIPEMHEQMNILCRRMPRGSFAIERFLNDTATYAESTYAGSMYAASVIEASEMENPELSPIEEHSSGLHRERRIQDATAFPYPDAEATPKRRPVSANHSVPPRPHSPASRAQLQTSEPVPASSKEESQLSPSQQVLQSVPSPPPPLATIQKSTELIAPAVVAIDPLAEAMESARRNRLALDSQQREDIDKQLFSLKWSHATMTDVCELLQKGADLNYNVEGDEYPSALEEALRNKRPPAAVKTLLDWGANANAKVNGVHEDSKGRKRNLGCTLNVAIACYRDNRIEIMKILLEAGADANAPVRYGAPLYCALAHSRRDSSEEHNQTLVLATVKLLVEYGANLKAMEERHGTPLHVAAYHGHSDAARYLVEHGADINALSVGWGSRCWLITPLEAGYRGIRNRAKDRAKETSEKAVEREEDNPVIGYLLSLGAKRLFFDD